MQFLRVPFVSCVLLSCSACVTTDPFRWNYAATVETETGTERFDLGTQTSLVEPSPDGTAEPTSQLFYQWQDLPRRTVTGSGTRSLPLGEPLFSWTHESGTHVFPTPPTGSTDSRIRIILNLTDVTSGETGTAEFNSGLELAHTSFWPGNTQLSGFVQPPNRATWVLGMNKYEVELEGGHTESSGTIDIRSLTGEPLGTPEPGTLALAGIGLGLVGLRLRRRLGERPA
ncbi:MAG: PEP-CTERM sorting domain-containing protein [Planctomycetia bacterium]|nr:PEP-CTERM sorting domain-containing protein [Planctomycetia bacterium]